MISGLHSALGGLLAFQQKTQAAAHNTANVNTDGFNKTRVTIEEGDNETVTTHIERIEIPGPLIFEQTGNGYEMVEKSNVDLGEELPQMAMNKRFYRANLKTIQTIDDMLGNLLDIKKV